MKENFLPNVIYIGLIFVIVNVDINMCVYIDVIIYIINSQLYITNTSLGRLTLIGF
jgi:hypothetical protein